MKFDYIFVFKLEFIYLSLYLVNVNLCEIFIIVFEWLDS